MNTIAIKMERFDATTWLLYTTSIVGILSMLATTGCGHIHTSWIAPDIIVYSTLFGFAYLIHKGLQIAKLFYSIIAFIWYTALVFFLHSNFQHPVNFVAVAIQIILTCAALYLSYS